MKRKTDWIAQRNRIRDEHSRRLLLDRLEADRMGIRNEMEMRANPQEWIAKRLAEIKVKT